MRDQIPAAVSSSLASLSNACRAWTGAGLSVTDKRILPVDVARAHELCDLLVRPAHVHTVMFWTACLSVVGLIALVVCGYVVIRGAIALGHLIVARLRARQTIS